MKIRGRFTEIEKKELADTTRDILLQVSIDGADIDIPSEEFNAIYNEERRNTTIFSPAMLVGAPAVGGDQTSEINSTPNFVQSLAFLLSKIGIASGAFLTEDDELIIESDNLAILDLPWEKAVRPNTVTYRQVLDITQIGVTDEKNFLVVSSLSHLPNKEDLGESIKNETKKIIDFIVNDNKPDFRVDSLFFLKNATKDKISSLDWAKYNFVHMMMHGEGDGRLCFEKAENYKDIDHMEIPDFISIFTSGNIQHLSCMFLSFCFSAGGGTMERNLSYELVRLGISQHVIAYNGSVGTDTAQKFSERFYGFLLNGSSIKEAFKNSLIQQRTVDNKVYVPVLYTSYINTSRVVTS